MAEMIAEADWFGDMCKECWEGEPQRPRTLGLEGGIWRAGYLCIHGGNAWTVGYTKEWAAIARQINAGYA